MTSFTEVPTFAPDTLESGVVAAIVVCVVAACLVIALAIVYRRKLKLCFKFKSQRVQTSFGLELDNVSNTSGISEDLFVRPSTDHSNHAYLNWFEAEESAV